MSSIKPIKTLNISGITLTPIGFWPYDEGSYYGEDQFWESGPAPQPVVFKLEGYIAQQDHGSFSTRELYLYNALDVAVGDWYVEASTGKALEIIAIDVSETNPNFVSCTIEDTDRWEQFSDPNGIAATGAPGFIVSISDDGLPVFNSLIDYQSEVAPNIGFFEEMISRFRERNLKVDKLRVNQAGHTFVVGDSIVLNPTATYSLADPDAADYDRIIGRVVDVGIPGANWFNYEPRGIYEENVTPSLPGAIGYVVWLDPSNPGKVTSVRPNSQAIPVYIKISDTSGIRLAEQAIQPIDNYNTTTNPTVNNDSSQGYRYGSKWINTFTGVAWILVDPTDGAAVWQELSAVPGPTGPVGPPQTGAYQRYTYTASSGQTLFMASHVPGYADVFYNNLKLLPSQYDDSNSMYIELLSPSVAGDPVEIVAWQIADISQLTGPTGPTGTAGALGPTGPAATGAYVRHEFIATSGQSVFPAAYYPGFVDVYYNGTLLMQDQYIATDGVNVVLLNPSVAGDPVVIVAWELTNISQNTGPTGPTGAFQGLTFNTIAERDTFAPTIGQIAYVLDDGTGYNSAYIVAQTVPSVVWIPINIAPGAYNINGNPALGERKYVNTISKQFDYIDTGAQTLGNLAANTTVMSVDVVITVPFTDATATMTVGTDSSPALLMSADMIYLDENATFINDQQQKLTVPTAAKVFINPGTSSAGEAQVTITYR
jgi:hypothetical protein